MYRKRFSIFAGVAISLLLAQVTTAANEDAGSAAPTFQEGDVLSFDDVDKLKPFLPEQVWDNRDFFFYEGMKLEIGPTQFDYSNPKEFTAATERYDGGPRIGPDNSLENYFAGEPFKMSEIDCLGDPQAGAKIMWNHRRQWRGSGGVPATFYYSYWDRGEQLPLYYEGTGTGVNLAHRVEGQYQETDGDLFRGEKRNQAQAIDVDAPFDARGIMLLTFRYKSSDGPRATAKNDDTWVYVPTLRRVRRISTAQRTDAVAGTDFTMDDLFSFNGIVPQYEWECMAETQVLAPMNTTVKAFPYERDHNFGPYGLSYADDRWELRDTMVVKMIPKNDDHPYLHKIIYLDKETLTAHYSFAYDRKGELWKIITHNKRWSEDHDLTGNYYPGWPGIEKPRDLHIVSDTIVNTQTGTGNRIEFWDRTGLPLKSKGKVRRLIDVGRLTKGR
ncbi:DUF1329 domain-containing protein [Myxococcota bacterium]|nr:DUF1329 domain-containing protein [Myxococcota bacterium]